MTLPVPSLDDRRFQDIVDQAKSLIPQYCPEWTDHNVSDPGVTLLELFAWMTDLLLYRVNQVPDHMYIKFLEMIGVDLEPPRSARAPVTFYLSAAQPNDISISEGTEVATVRTETSPAIVFTTEADLTVRTPQLIAALTRGPGEGAGDTWVVHDLPQLELPGQKIALFAAPPAPGGAFYIGLQRDHSQHVLAVVVDCELAGGAGVDPRNPPLEWQVWQGGLSRWANCDIEYDGTGGFNRSGEIILHTPRMAEGEFQGVRGYWLRCRLTEPQAGQGSYRVSPDLEQIQVEARGGTVPARHATTIRDEVLGTSDSTSGQQFSLLHAPVLARDPERDYLVVELPGAESQRWTEVADFADSTPADLHYTLSSLDGTLLLGPTLLQPDGSAYRFGATPPRGSTLRFTRYQHGGGVAGNVPTGMLTVPKSSIPYVSYVSNRSAVAGGRDAQTLEDAKLRAPQVLRTRSRAVTADDYEYLAREVRGVARARCLAPAGQPGTPGEPRPGQVFVALLPDAGEVSGHIPPERLALSAELRASVIAWLDDRRPIGTQLEIIPPQMTWIAVNATLRVPERSEPGLVADVQRLAEAALYRYLNPYDGGPRGDGWPFGRDLHNSEIVGVLQRVPGVEFVEEVRMGLWEPGSSAEPRPAPPRVSLPRHGLICSGRHQIVVSVSS